MSNESGNKIVGGVILLGILVVLMSLIGAFLALRSRQFSGAGIFMLAASLPITAAIHGLLKKR